MASSNAACVFGGVRFISSARMMFEKTGPGNKFKIPVFAQYFRTDNIRWHQVGRKLYAAKIQVEHLCNCLHQQGFCQTGHTNQQDNAHC